MHLYLNVMNVNIHSILHNEFLFQVGSQHDMIVNVWDWKNNIKERPQLVWLTNFKEVFKERKNLLTEFVLGLLFKS